MIAKKKQTRLRPLSPTAKKRLKERGESIGRKVVRPPRPPRGKSRDICSKVLMAPEPQAPRTTKRPKSKFSKGVGSLLGGAAASVLKTAAGKKKSGKTPQQERPKGMGPKRLPISRADLEKIKRLLKDKLGNTKRGEPVKPKFKKPVAKFPPKKRRAGFMKK